MNKSLSITKYCFDGLRLTLSALLAISLFSCGRVRPPDVFPTPVNTSLTTNTANEMVVYLDTSISMAGYVLPENQKSLAAKNGYTVFSHTLRELSSVITLIRPSVKIYYREVNRNVGEIVENDHQLIRAATDRSVYQCDACDQTNLAGAINAFSQPLKSETQNSLAFRTAAQDNTNSNEDKKDLLPRFHILITDGVPSKKGSDDGCTRGSDATCVKNKIFQLIENGWGATVLGIRSEFNGKVYSEVDTGIANENRSIPGNLKTYRPFYLYVLSPDRASVKDLVEKIKTELRKNLSKNGDELRELPLTDLSADKPKTNDPRGEVGFAVEDQAKNPDAGIETVKNSDGNDDRFKFLVKMPRTIEEPLNLSLKPAVIAWSESAKSILLPQQLNQPLKWELQVVDQDKENQIVRYPEVKLLNPQPNEKNEFQLKVGWENKAGSTGWRIYRLVGRLDLEKQKPSWIAEWSTRDDRTPDTTWQTLNLETSLGMLWHNPALEQQVIVEICFVVGESYPPNLRS